MEKENLLARTSKRRAETLPNMKQRRLTYDSKSIKLGIRSQRLNINASQTGCANNPPRVVRVMCGQFFIGTTDAM